MTDTTTIHKTIFFNASREVVWSFLTDREKLAQWYHPAEEDLADGLDYTLFRLDDDGARVPQVWGRVLKWQPHELLVQTFVVKPFGEAETIVTWALEDASGGTRLSLTHEGVAEAAGPATMQMLMALDDGWDEHLGDLRKAGKRYAEQAAA